LKFDHDLFIKGGKWLGLYPPEGPAPYPLKVVFVGEKGLVTIDRDSGLLARLAKLNPRHVTATENLDSLFDNDDDLSFDFDDYFADSHPVGRLCTLCADYLSPWLPTPRCASLYAVKRTLSVVVVRSFR